MKIKYLIFHSLNWILVKFKISDRVDITAFGNTFIAYKVRNKKGFFYD